MTTNPYAAPVYDASNGESFRERDLELIRLHFRNLNCSVASGVFATIVGWILPLSAFIAAPLAPISFLLTYLFSVVLCFNVFSVGGAIFRVCLSFIPLINFIVFWEIHSKARRILKESGHKIGFFGAAKLMTSSKDIPTAHVVL